MAFGRKLPKEKLPRVRGYRSMKCCQGHIHDSTAEASYCMKLWHMQKSGEIISYRTQIMYNLVVNDKKVCGHIVDFEVVNAEGKIEVHEVKGFATEVWVLKRKLFEAVYPNIPYIVIDARRLHR